MDNDDKILFNPDDENNKKEKYKDQEVENFINNGEEDGLEDIEDVAFSGLSDEPLENDNINNNEQRTNDSQSNNYKDKDTKSNNYKDKDTKRNNENQSSNKNQEEDRKKEDERNRKYEEDRKREQDDKRYERDDSRNRRSEEDQRQDDDRNRRYEEDRRRNYDDRDRRRDDNRRRDDDDRDNRYEDDRRRDDDRDRRYEEDRQKDYDDRDSRYEDDRRRYNDRDNRYEDNRDRRYEEDSKRDYDDRRRDDDRQRRYEDDRQTNYNEQDRKYTSLKDEVENLKSEPNKSKTDKKNNSKNVKGKETMKKSKGGKSNFTVFMGFVAVIAVVTFVLALTFMIKAFKKDTPGNTTQSTTPNIGTVAPKPDKTTITKAIVINIEDNKSLRLYDFKNLQLLDLVIDKNSSLKDNYNKNLVAKELKVGDIADLEFYTLEKNIIEFKISSDTWEKKNINNININSSASTITVGDTIYDYDKRIIVTQKGKEVELSTVSKADIVTAKGYGNSILYLEIVKGHGVVEIANKQLVSEGTLEIGTIFFTKLDDTQGVFDVPEDKYHIIIKGVNIENYSKEIEVKEGQKTIVDLADVQIKSGALSVKLEPQDAILTVNNEVKSAAQPIVLDYGKYTVKVAKEGFRDEEIEVTINQPLVNVEFKLENLVIYGLVNVTTNPAGADVYIDDVNYGKSPISENIPVGNHSITVRKEGYEDLSSPINVTDRGVSADLILKRIEEPNPPTSFPTTTDDEFSFPDDNMNPYN